MNRLYQCNRKQVNNRPPIHTLTSHEASSHPVPLLLPTRRVLTPLKAALPPLDGLDPCTDHRRVAMQVVLRRLRQKLANRQSGKVLCDVRHKLPRVRAVQLGDALFPFLQLRRVVDRVGATSKCR